MQYEQPISEGISFEWDGMHYRHMVTRGLSLNAHSLHTHGIFEIIYFISGDATHVVEDRKYKLRRGDLILVRPMHYHFIQIDGDADYERYNLLFDTDELGIDIGTLIPADIDVISTAQGSDIEQILERCDRFYKGLGEEQFAKVLPHMICELFFSASLAAENKSEESLPVSPLISAALRIMNESLTKDIQIGEIAERLFVSESYLFRLFKQELHRSPKKYLNNKRLLLARKKIKEGKKPSAVCEECGFGDYTGFYRSYVSLFGHSPAEDKPQ